MTQIHKFSQLYDTFEDRMAWDTEGKGAGGEEGETTRLWLTQRLCRGLVGAIVNMLQKKDTPDAAPGAAAGSSAALGGFGSEHSSMVQAWEQVAAMAEFGKTPPVQPKPQAPSGLVTAVHMKPTSTGVSMTFDFGAGEHRNIHLSRKAVRQTLSVMYRLHVSAGWPMDFWPDWVADPEASAAVPDAVLN